MVTLVPAGISTAEVMFALRSATAILAMDEQLALAETLEARSAGARICAECETRMINTR